MAGIYESFQRVSPTFYEARSGFSHWFRVLPVGVLNTEYHHIWLRLTGFNWVFQPFVGAQLTKMLTS